MSSLGAAVGQFLHAVEHHQNLQELQVAMAAVQPLIVGSKIAVLNDQLRRFPTLIRDAHLVTVGALAMTAGAMVENRGDPLICGNALLSRLPDMLRGIVDFYTELKTHVDEQTENIDWAELAELHAPAILENNPPAAWGYIAEQSLALGTISHLGKSKDLRGIAQSRSELVELSNQADTIKGDGMSFLTSILQVLDDEILVVLHPAEQKGYEVSISGLSDNFQLHTLLADAILGRPDEGWIDGTRPNPDVVMVARDRDVPEENDLIAEGSFTLWSWNGLQSDGTVPVNNTAKYPLNQRIWNEGNPRSIPLLNGRRVVLVGPILYATSWRAGRRIPVMEGDLTVERKLTAEEVTTWLECIRSESAR